MKRLGILLLLLCSTTAGALAQSDAVLVHPVFHGSLALQLDTLSIWVDPYGGANRFQELPAPDLVLITDIHGDHYNPETLWKLELQGTTILVPAAVNEQIPDSLSSGVRVIGNGEKLTFGSLQLEAIPMYNLPETADSRHPKGRGNGYVLEQGDTRVYISGDTEDIPEMRALQDIDIAFVCMNLPYTMTVEQAADAVNQFRPKVVYPYHFRGKDGFADVEKFKQLVHQAHPEIEVRLEQWYNEE